MANAHVLIDTNPFIEHLRIPEVEKKINSVFSRCLEMFSCYTSTVTVFELYTGVKTEQHRQSVRNVLRFLEGILPIDIQAAETAGEIASRLLLKNQRIGEIDSLIAGVCLNHGMPIITRNVKHFQRVPNLIVIPANIVERFDSAEDIIRHSI
jgi:predicted nucleic acid-binding protein